MVKNIFLDKTADDKRIGELVKLFEADGVLVHDFRTPQKNIEGESIAYLLPRNRSCQECVESLPKGTRVFGYDNNTLNSDEVFIRETNHQTAEAMREILEERYGVVPKKILLIGAGKLAAQLELVLSDAEIHILNFNQSKKEELQKQYGERAHFEKVEFRLFDVIINTVPKEVVGRSLLQPLCVRCNPTKKSVAIYELASPPYGFDWTGLRQSDFDYKIEPALPGRFYPAKAARSIYDAIKRASTTPSEKPSIVLCITASSCTYTKLLPIVEDLIKTYDVIPVLSHNAAYPNRFCNIDEFRTSLAEITGNKLITHIAGAELLSSNKRVVASLVLPATGNTIAKIANAITDTSVTMAVKALLRNSKPCILGISTNDALSGQAENLGKLLARKNVFFIPYSQDDPEKKPFSCVCDFTKVNQTIELALKGKQLQPILTG